ncbi:hypothetical protein [Coleofasciculus sp. H7-2]|uniref:hypothetical protein n=1 Tax=Coleofasciculus sp. H7-2 TaxID=3351545 RepID=UPI00366CC9AF
MRGCESTEPTDKKDRWQPERQAKRWKAKRSVAGKGEAFIRRIERSLQVLCAIASPI